MTILVTGSTGTIGSQVVQRLTRQSERIRALVRDDASKVKVPAGVEPVKGDMMDIASMRAVLEPTGSVSQILPDFTPTSIALRLGIGDGCRW